MCPKFRLEGEVAIVSGGAEGIGEATEAFRLLAVITGGIGEVTVRVFVKDGAKVVIADINDVKGSTLAAALSPWATYVHCNVSEDIVNLIDSTISRYRKLDILYNNAGVLGSQSKRKNIMDFDVEEFDKVMDVNVKRVALGMKHAAGVMMPRRTWCIISTASVARVMGGLGPHAYTASKNAIGLTKNTTCELGRYGIRVNSKSIFGVATSMLINAWKKSEDNEDEEEECMDSVDGSPYDQEVEKMEFVRNIVDLKSPTLRPKDIASKKRI